MTTRSGRGFKSPDMSTTEEITTGGVDGGPPAREDEEGGRGSPDAAVDVAAVVQMLIEDRRRPEDEVAAERVRREHDMDRRVSEMKEQMEAMYKFTERSGKNKSQRGEALVKVAKLSDTDDIEGYLLTFERQMAAYEIEKSHWAFILAPQLSGRAQKAYMAMAPDESGDYHLIKKATLKRYDISEESHRRKFRERAHGKGESFSELATSLLDLANKWLEECSTKEGVVEKLAIEQFLANAPEDVHVWVREHKPKTCAEAGQWADEFQQARSGTRVPYTKGPETTRPGEGPPGRCRVCNQTGHPAYNCPKLSYTPGVATTPAQRGPMPHRHQQQQQQQRQNTDRRVRCYSCGKMGHIAMHCPTNALFCTEEGTADVLGAEIGEGVTRQGTVEGVPAEVWLDTGSARTLVRRELVPEDKVLAGKVVAVRCAHGEIVRYPLAELEVTVDGRKIAITAGVAEKLPVQLLLGRDVAELFSLLCADSRANSVDIAPVVVADVGETVAVTTRAQSRSARGTIDSGSETVATSSNTALDDTVDNVGAEFDEDLFEGGTERRRMTRSQKRLERHQYTSEGGVGATTEKSKWGGAGHDTHGVAGGPTYRSDPRDGPENSRRKYRSGGG